MPLRVFKKREMSITAPTAEPGAAKDSATCATRTNKAGPGWNDLAPELKIRVAQMLDYGGDVFALGRADVALIPYLAADPHLPIKQRAYNKAITNLRGPALVAAVREHRQAFWASERDWLEVREDETLDVVVQLCRLREGRGPQLMFHVDLDVCHQRLFDMPTEVHVDVDISAGLKRRREPTWSLPVQASCLLAGPDGQNYTWPPQPPRLEVRGRHAFGYNGVLERMFFSYLHLTRGRLDLSGVTRCGEIEISRAEIGE